MKRLLESFKSNGFQFRQLWREGNVALFEKSKNGGVASFEVVRIQHRKARFAFGKVLPAGEVLPCSERWGKDGWTFCDLASARKKFNELTKAQEWPAAGTPRHQNRVAGAVRVFALAGRD